MKKNTQKAWLLTFLTAMLLSAGPLWSRTSLMKAVIENDVTDIEKILSKSDPEVNESDDNGLTALHYAAFYGRMDAAKKLVEKGAAVDAQDRFGFTPLHLSILSFYAEMELQPDQLQIVRETKNEITEFLISSGANVRTASGNGVTPVHLALQYLADHEALAIRITEKAGSLKDLDREKGRSVLFFAATGGNPRLIALAASKGATLKSYTASGTSLLCHAASFGKPEITEALLKAGANPRFVPPVPEARSAVFCAMHEEILVQFSKRGVSLKEKNKQGFTAYDLDPNHVSRWKVNIWDATHAGDLSAIRKFVELGGNVDRIGYYKFDDSAYKGFAPLHIAVLRDSPATVKLLLELKADRNLPHTATDYEVNRALGQSMFSAFKDSLQSEFNRVGQGFAVLNTALTTRDAKAVEEAVKDKREEALAARRALALAIKKNNAEVISLLSVKK